MGIDIGHNIKSARNAAGLTQEELARQCGVATITIRQYESGKREPKYDTLERLADALDIPVEVLLGIGDSIREVGIVGAEVREHIPADVQQEYGTLSTTDLLILKQLEGLTDEDKQLILAVLDRLKRTGEEGAAAMTSKGPYYLYYYPDGAETPSQPPPKTTENGG